MTNAVLTAYFTHGDKMDRHPVHNYPEGPEVWELPTEVEPQKPQLGRLAESVAPYGELIVATDSLKRSDIPKHLRDTVTLFPMPSLPGNFFMARWDAIKATIEARPDLENVYAVDGRDVIVVRDPWDYIRPGTLYTCTEPRMLPGLRRWRGQPLGRSGFINDVNYHSSPVIQEWVRANQHLTALNAGVSAGDRETMLRLASEMSEARLWDHVQNDYTDMALFNYIAHTSFRVVGDESYIGAKCHLADEAPEARVLHIS